MTNQMTFLLDLIRLGEELPKFSPKAGVQSEADSNTNLPQKLYKCPVCRSRFIYLTSFIRTCSSHLSDVRSSEVQNKEVDLVFKTEIAERIEIEENTTDTEEETSTSFSASENEQTGQKNLLAKKGKIDYILPKDHVFCCQICDKTFIRRQTYRDHLLGHENPLIKCCTICTTQFSSGIIASKHKKKFHPELYQREMRERAEERAKYGRCKTIYHTIPKSTVVKNDSVLTKSLNQHQLKDLKIVLDRIYLPGFVKNDWIYHTKKKENCPWFEEKIKDETRPKYTLKRIKDENQAYDCHSADDNDFNDDFMNIKSESQIHVATNEQSLQNDNVKQRATVESKGYPFQTSSFYIKPEEIAHIPAFLGAKYIFNVYDERRNKKLKANKKKKKSGRTKSKRETSDEDTAGSVEKVLIREKTQSDFMHPFPRKQSATYKPDPKICLICGETRTKSNIRRHIATHCFEEDDRECRICGTSHTAANKLREHYSRLHNIKFREYLYKMQKEKMERIAPHDKGPSNYVTCNICYTNMKTEDHLKYHYDMLHNYKPGGGKTKATDLDCHLCGKTFKEAQTRNLHVRRIHKQMFDGQIFCDYCGKDFMGKGYLLSHFRYAHFDENGVFKESIAKKAKYEGSKNKDKQMFICEMCGEVKETKATMMKHRHEKHGALDPEYAALLEKDYEENDCPHCTKHFTSIRKYKDHEKYHLKEQSDLFCQVCGIKCKTDIFLKAHMQRHGEKKFFCEFEGCLKGFAVKYDYLTHKKRAHGTGESFPCKRCEQIFRTWKQRRNHEEIEHGIVKIKLQRNKRLMPNAGYKDDDGGDCRFCGKHFDNYRKWQNHEYHHKKIIPDLHCEICGAKSTTEYNLKRHMERHGEIQYFCDYPGCGKGFTVKHDVRIHARRAHKDLFQQQQTISVSSSPVYSESGSQHQVFHVYPVLPPN